MVEELGRVVSDPLGQWSGDGDSNGWGGDGEYVLEDNGTQGEVHTTAKWIIIWDGSSSTPSGYRTSGLNIPDWTDAMSVGSDDT